ncbi:hypothetical protein [Candidatus Uabimicrobium amorphum]|uniref:Glycosyl transferase family 28 C-terminal domain-containing protein n=1 Tax=Uabimicrobium amorphum TaxID=2596890 RepID=A0A5S9F5Q6_UABAM|nr:hypothetical protein [Candidatus Uabimicrobium amorphum]BBM87097.1 hypothetical protein UABAM_05500 [Candidatus Uabimicrobium amorphum]
MKTVIFTAQPFGFGPVSKAIAIAEQISNATRIFFGTGVALDLAKIHDFEQVYELSHDDVPQISSLLQNSDVFINVMDFPLIDIAAQTKCTSVLVDSLFWWWPTIPQQTHLADIYFCQDFIQPITDRIRKDNMHNAQVITPIITKHFNKGENINQAIINFGGCDGRVQNSFILVGKNSNYPFVILKLLLPILKKHFESILVTGRECVMDQCQSKFADDQVQYKMLSPKQMLSELHRSQVCFTTPGIQTFYDAADKLPLFFLPPSNHSHVDNLQLFADYKIATNYFDWQQVCRFPYNKCTTRQQKIDLVLSAIRQFSQNLQHQKVFMHKVKNFLVAKRSWPHHHNNQQKVLQKLGTNGAQQIVSAIDNFTSQRNQAMIFS